MTVTVEQDFREFVVARWGELEAVARLVVLDGPVARRVTTDALADLQARWAELLDEGTPGAAARRGLLRAALAAAPRREQGRPGDAGNDPAYGSPDPDDGRDAVVTALLPVLYGATPLERAVLAATDQWGLPGEAVADLLGMPTTSVRDADDAVRRRLLQAHSTARAAAGREPAEWALDRDVADAVGLLLTGAADPPDPVALVGERRRTVRRRSVVLGTGGALLVGAAGAWSVGAVVDGAASEAAVSPPPPGDPVWATAASWPARGRLATDAGVAALVAGSSPRAHLLWADDLSGHRAVVAATADDSGAAGTLVRMWTGPAGADPAMLTPANLVRDQVAFLDDVVPVAVEAGDGEQVRTGAVLLLAGPGVLEATYSALVSYALGGGVARRWTTVRLRDGVATIGLRGALPPAFRVRLDGYDGGPLGATPLGLPAPSPSGPLAESLLEALGPFVAACTGLPPQVVQSSVALEVPVPGDVLVQATHGEAPGPGVVVVAHTRLPSGALLRSVRVSGGGRGDLGPLDIETTRPLGDDEADAPFAARLPAFRADVSRFLVMAPGAARAQLVATSSSTYPASEVTALHEGAGVLEVADARRAAMYSLVTWDRRGRRLGAWDALFRRRDPRDLWPRVR